MTITYKDYTRISCDITAEDMINMAKTTEKVTGEADSKYALMSLIFNSKASKALANELGLSEENCEIEVDEDTFDKAVLKCLEKIDRGYDEERPMLALSESLTAMVFYGTLRKRLFGGDDGKEEGGDADA